MTRENSLAAVILAAGHGKRMKSELPKVLHRVGGVPMIRHVIEQAFEVSANPVVVVVGHGRDRVIPVVREAGADYVIQEEQLGTGHAVQMAEPLLKDFEGDLIVLSGDVPLLKRETLLDAVSYHKRKNAVATIITAQAPDPSGYGRVLRGDNEAVSAIREDKDCSPQELKISEINSGIYVFRSAPLFKALQEVDRDNAQQEYYLPDVFSRYFSDGRMIAAFTAGFDEIHGINTPEDLAEAQRIFERN